MATVTRPVALAPGIRSVLAGVRRRIRLYIWLEGLSVAVIWLGATFWIALGLDYLPVLVGASEMPPLARGVLLAVMAGVLTYILYRYILRRIGVPLHDRSMAILLERKFTGFQDSLVTAVEMDEEPDHAKGFNVEMLSRTVQQAGTDVGDVSVGRVFNYTPLYLRLATALALALSVAAFTFLNPTTMTLAAERLYLLASEPWPRSAHIEIVGLEVQRSPAPGETIPRTLEVKFENNVVKIAKGASATLKVRALGAPQARVTPQYCTVYYRELATDAGSRGKRGSVTMTGGRDAGGYRNFRYDGKPFKSVISTVEFDVLGYDHRVAGYRLEVVDSPAIVSTKLDLTYPPYMVDEATSNNLPVQDKEYLPGGTDIPQGTNVTVKFRANKDLKKAEIRNVETGQLLEIPIGDATGDKQSFEYQIDRLAASTTLEISLLDTDNVLTDRPHKIFLTAVEDRPPQVDIRLRGIGTSVTPDVMIPVQGKLSDDYAVAKAWFEAQVNEGAARKLDVGLGKGGTVDQTVDFRQLRIDDGSLELKPRDKLSVVVQGEDRFNLGGDPHVGSSDRYQLDVVTPDELLAQLEVRELQLRRRFELTLDELNQLRDSLVRVKAGLTPGAASETDPEDLQPDDATGKPLTKEQIAQRAAELRLLRVQRGLQQSQKSAQEVLGIATGFADIREELINNRVDTEERKKRLKELISDPLAKIGAEEFPKLDQNLGSLEKLLREAASPDPTPENAAAADKALEQTNVTIEKLEQVLQQMLDLETYNEILDIVRDLLKDQESLIDKTKQERKRQALEDLK